MRNRKLILLAFIFTLLSAGSYSQELPYKTGEKLNARFYEAVKNMDEIFTYDYAIKTSSIRINVFIDKNSDNDNNDPEWNYKGILQVGNYFRFLESGINPEIKVENVVGNDQSQELTINTGCFDDGGCNDKLFFCRIFENKPFTITEIEGRMIDVNELLEMDKCIPFNKTGLKQEVNAIKMKGACVLGNWGGNGTRCYYQLKAINLSANGFSWAAYNKKVYERNRGCGCPG